MSSRQVPCIDTPLPIPVPVTVTTHATNGHRWLTLYTSLYELSASASVLQDKRPTNATHGYDFRETSTASHDVVVEKVRKIDFGNDKDFTGARDLPQALSLPFQCFRQLEPPALHSGTKCHSYNICCSHLRGTCEPGVCLVQVLMYV